jgi:ClpP class serine protease
MTHILKAVRAKQWILNKPIAMELMAAKAFFRTLYTETSMRQAGPQALYDSPAETAEDNGSGICSVHAGVAIIEIRDVLVQRDSDCWWYGLGYDVIAHHFLSAVNNAEVKAVVLNIDSGGGDCAGLFDLVELIYAARGKKPIWAILEETAYSAAYAIASACDKIYVPQTGGVGSIGVIALFPDESKMLNDFGVTINVVQFGARKADGAWFAPMSDDARQSFQGKIDQLGNLFVDLVARNRDLRTRDIIAQQADTFIGPKGVEEGLADEVASPVEALNQLLQKL